MKNPFNSQLTHSFSDRRKFVEKYQQDGSTKQQRLAEVSVLLMLLTGVAILIAPPIGLFIVALYLLKK